MKSRKSLFSSRSSRTNAARRNRPSSYRNRLKFESLEDRRMLAITVTIAADVVAMDGETSLREAVILANNSADNVIDFDQSLVFSAGTLAGLGILELTGGQLNILDTLTIDASAINGRIIIDANNNSRIFNFSNATGDFTLDSITIRDGNSAGSGAGVFFGSSGELTLIDSEVTGNTTTGNDSDGGGIFTNFGDVTLTRSTVSGNRTRGNDSDGGGIRTQSGNVTLSDSTVSGNSTEGDDSDGGGIRTIGGDITITNSTVSGNRTEGADSDGGGVRTNGGAVTVDFSTIVANTVSQSTSADGAGLSLDPDGLNDNEQLTIVGSIVADNGFSFNGDSEIIRGIGSPDFLAPTGANATLSVERSLIGDNTGTTLAEAQTLDADGNLVGTELTSIDPRLGPLQNNGGGTLTHAPLFGSPAIDLAGILFPSQFDQRGDGFSRISNGAVDAGAVELSHFVVDDTGPLDDGLPDNGVTTLREAIALAEADPGPSLITFDPSLDGATIDLLASGELLITQSLTIDATSLPGGITIDGGGLSRVINIDTDSSPSDTDIVNDFTLAGLTLTGGQSSGEGGALRAFVPSSLNTPDSSVTILESTISGSTAVGDGGGAFLEADDVLVERSTIAGNTSFADGGGLALSQSAQVVASTISGNTATGRGGGVFGGDYIDLNLTSSTVSGNSADGYGGGVYNEFIGFITSSTITANSSATGGGGVAAPGSLTILTNSLVSGNDTGGVADNLGGPGASFSGSDFNLFGDTSLQFGLSGQNNITGVNNAGIGPLQDNGGLTFTHALLPGSLAIDAGTNTGSVFLDPQETDQRGEQREFGLGPDIGAFELQQFTTFLPGDFNDDETVGAADYTVWRDNFGIGGVPAFTNGDGDGDGDADVDDYDVWVSNFGASLATAATSTASLARSAVTLDTTAAVSELLPAQETEATDAAFALRLSLLGPQEPDESPFFEPAQATAAYDNSLLLFALDKVEKSTEQNPIAELFEEADDEAAAEGLAIFY